MTIDRLVLRGFKDKDAPDVAEGIRCELARALTNPETGRRLLAGAQLTQVHLGKAIVNPAASPQQTGVEVARAIGKGIAK